MVDACAVESLKNLKKHKQNLSAILMYQKTFDEEQQSLDYMAVIGRLEVTLEYLIKIFKERSIAITRNWYSVWRT